MKICKACGVRKPLHEFHKDSTKRGGYRSKCKQCMKEHAVQTDPQRLRKKRLKTYGISPDDYNKMYDQQGGVCAICGLAQSASYTNHLSVDHSHSTGAVRGLLCHHCNTGLGHFKDDPRLLNKASDYLMQYLQP